MDNSANCTHKRSFKLDKYAFSTRIMNRMNKYHGFICLWVEFVFTCISDTLFILVNMMICLDDKGISHYIYNYAEVSIQKLCLQCSTPTIPKLLLETRQSRIYYCYKVIRNVLPCMWPSIKIHVIII